MIITAENNYRRLENWLEGKKKVLLVCGSSIRFFENLCRKLDDGKIPMVRFSDFHPNPLYESVVAGVRLFREKKCDAIIAVGGGSAIDVAKCIKLYSGVPEAIPFLAVPTTAGTGSEATRYAVIYYKGEKQSVTSEEFIPDTVLMDPDMLKTLSLYQKKATMMDAFSHAIESFWSVNSTEESKGYSKAAMKGVLVHMEGYLANTEDGNAGMLMASHIAGKAIDITQTTAGHAMCYKITSLYKAAHGHAAILCNRVLFPWMVKNTDKCIDPRGEAYLKNTLDEIGRTMGCRNADAGAKKLAEIFDSLELDVPTVTQEQYDELKRSVNPERLKNHPIALEADTIHVLYHDIMR